MKSFLTFAEALKGKQHKIDADKDGKIEAEDLAKLRAMKKEETELDEKMNLAKASMGDVIKDFKKSDAPQFAGKSAEKRREMAIAAKLEADRGVKEEVEQIDELSKSTLGSYVKKASTNARINSMISKDFDHKAMTARKPSTRDAYYGLSSKHKQKSWKRSDNVSKAVDRLAKEEVELEEVEELDEDKYDRMLSSMLKGKSGERLLKKHSDEVKKTKDIESGKTLNKLVKKNPGVLKTHSAAVKRDKKIYGEEVEQIDELSFNTLASYASKVDQKDKQPLSKKRQAGYNSAAERMSQKAQTADLKKWGKISDSVEYNFDNEGNLMPNPVSFKEFLSQLDEIKMADLPSRKVSGRGYGTEYYKKEAEKDKSGYDDEKKEKSEVKRGRGRPVGSASGARQKGSTTGKKRSGVEMTGYPLHLPNKN